MSVAPRWTVLGRPRPMSALESLLRERWLLAGMALLGLAWGGVQVALTRLLAVLFAPEVVVACLTVGLAGLGLGAALMHALARRLEPAVLPVGAALAAAGATALAAVLVPLLGRDGAALAAVLVGLPAVGVGAALASGSAAIDRRSGRLVGLWAVGAAAGLPGGLALLAVVAPSAALVALAALLAAASLCAALATGRLVRPAGGGLVALAVAAMALGGTGWLAPPAARLGPPGEGLGAILRRPDLAAVPDVTRWDGGGRLDVVETSAGPRTFVDGRPADWATPPDLTPLLPSPRARVLTIIPAGPGLPPAAPPGLTPTPTLATTLAGDGRAWLRGGGGAYDLIALTGPGEPALHPAGAALAGQYDLTVEAMDDYLLRLTPGGLLVLRLPSEPALYRAALTVVAALERRGVATQGAAHHLVLVGRPTPLLVASLGPLTQDEAAALRDRLATAGWTALHIPHLLPGGPLGDLAAGQPMRRLPRLYPGYQLMPATDASPAFSMIERDLPTTLVLTLVLTAMALLGTLGYTAWTVEPDHYRVWRAITYAAALGAIGPLLLAALTARLSIWLEGPTAAAVMATAALGGWMALGAALSDRLKGDHWGTAGRAAGLLLAAWCALEAVGLLLPVDRLVLPSLPLRFGIAAVLLAAPGVALGLLLPLLLRAAQRQYAGRPVALVWGAYGGAAALAVAGAWALTLRLGLPALFIAVALVGLVLALLARPTLGR